MRFRIILALTLFTSSIWATSFSTPKWELNIFEQISNSNLQSISIEIEYVLTDNCELSIKNLSESSYPSIFTRDVSTKLIAKYIGPYNSKKQVIFEPIFPWDSEVTLQPPPVRDTMIRWPTTEGRKYIQCFFSSKDKFLYAEYVHPNVAPAPTAPRIEVKEKLSELGRRIYKHVYTYENDL